MEDVNLLPGLDSLPFVEPSVIQQMIDSKDQVSKRISHDDYVELMRKFIAKHNIKDEETIKQFNRFASKEINLGPL